MLVLRRPDPVARPLPVLDPGQRAVADFRGPVLRVLGAPDRNHRELTQRSIEHVIVELARHPGPWVCRLDVWATSVAVRVALDVLRARAQRRDVGASWGDAMSQSSANDRNAASPGSAIDQLRWLLTELPAQQAEALVSCDVMGLAVEDVAQTLHVGVEHVRRLLSAGHERLARQMSTDARA